MDIKENKVISENNIKEYIESNLNQKTWSEIYFELKKEVEKTASTKKETELYSMIHNYTPIFMYYAIQRNCQLEEFAKILQISKNYESGLHRFFDNPDCKYEEKDNSHIYNQMNYLFYKKENNRMIFDENKINYIYEIIKNARTQNLLDFHSSRIDYFLVHVIKNNNKIGKSLINLISETPNMLLEEHTQYPNMPMSIMEIFADLSYQKDVSEYYQLSKENSIFYNLLLKNILKLNYEKKYKTNLSIYKMVSTNEKKYFDIFMKRVNELKKELNKKEYVDLINDVLFSIEESVKENPFELDLKTINTENNIIDNIPFLIALGKIINLGLYDLILGENKELKPYLDFHRKQSANYDFNSQEMTFEENYLIKKIQYDTIEKYFQYQKLNKKLEPKKNKTLKNKI